MIPPIDFTKWIDEHAHLLKPPVGNKVVFEDGKDFIVMVVGGPNQRTDFHVDPYEELFFQIRGNMHLNVMTPEGPDTIHIREGQMFLLPGNLPHSPQREANSVGLVVEKIREEGLLEKFQWYCLECSNKVHEVELQVRDIVKDLPPVFQAFYEDEKARTCDNCGALHPGKG
ncbi:3-hydroxyanthranilate 3,4-dioxygenase [Nonomuraea sediminis]|uniref:3-hydroxyanthranilate 3,4-dioxygenase n=1 Tax=Nonomuraea sediminis TaxID=2835864 RepID=UPI001BDC84D9|nr:3-hydroxyanthranilate 3,4-dioxygenase [Nonomuraea sediminis]